MTEMDHHYTALDIQTDDFVVSTRRGDMDVQGILTGSVIVNQQAKFAVNGIMHGDLLVNEGATVEIRGVLDAPTILSRGQLDIYGTVICPMGVPETAVLHPGCVVNGVKYN